MRGQQALAVIGALALVTSAVLAAPTGYVGTATAKHECEFSDSLTLSLLNSYDQDISGQECTLLHGDTEPDAGIDNYETKQSLVSGAATAIEQSNIYLTSYQNGLEGTETIARSEALAAYYRALENGSSESAARIDARRAVEDFYTVRQQNLIESSEALALAWLHYENISNSEGLPERFVRGETPSQTATVDRTILEEETTSATTVNGTTIDFTRAVLKDSSGNAYRYRPTERTKEEILIVARNNDTFETQTSPPDTEYGQIWHDIENQTEDVKANVDTYINNTYSQYQQGTLNATEIAGANTLAREFAAEGDFQNWAVIRLSQMEGADPPQNLSNTGYFRVDNGLNTYEGILLSGENPSSGHFEVGGTYNASQLSGGQYVVTNTSTRELSGEFVIKEITNDDGESLQNASIREINYSVANTSEYQALLDDMEELRAELEARQDMNGGGGLLPDFGGLGGVGGIAAIAVVAGGGLLLMNNRDDGVTVVDRTGGNDGSGR